MTTSVGKTSLAAMGKAAQKAAKKLARVSTEVRNQALLNLADALEQDQSDVFPTLVVHRNNMVLL